MSSLGFSVQGLGSKVSGSRALGQAKIAKSSFVGVPFSPEIP